MWNSFELFSLSVGRNRAIDHPAGHGLPADDWIVIPSDEEDGPIVISSDEEEAGEYEAGEYQEAMLNGFIRRFIDNSSDEEEADEEGAGEHEVERVNENFHRWMAPVEDEDSDDEDLDTEDDEDDLRELDLLSDSDFYSSSDSGYSSMDDSSADSEDDQRLPRNGWYVRDEVGWHRAAPPTPPRLPAVPERLVVRAPEERPGQQEDHLEHPSDFQGCEECAPSTSGFRVSLKRSREEEDTGQGGSKRQRLDLEGSHEEPAPSTSGLGSSTNRSSWLGPLVFPRFPYDSDSD